MKKYFFCLLFIQFYSSCTGLHAQWSTNTTINNQICIAPGEQSNVQIISDDAQGAIICWVDERTGSRDIYAQRINSAGFVLWNNNGTAISIAANFQQDCLIVPDGSGGAIIAWKDTRNGADDIYAQRVNAAGNVQWAMDGVPVCTAVDYQTELQMISDGNGGAILTWMDQRSGTTNDIYAQYIDGAGNSLWAVDGIPVCSAANTQGAPKIASDGGGGAIITWYDGRDPGDDNLYAQRVDSAGIAQWTMDGILVCSDTNAQYSPTIVADGTGGAVIAWNDSRSTGLMIHQDIYVQKINASGLPQWTTNGVAICVDSSDQYGIKMTSDGSGGAVITWTDWRGPTQDIYAQRISAAGLVQWITNGVAICTAPGYQYNPEIISDNAGGAMIIWYDQRSGTNSDIYAQHINILGDVWVLDGIIISDATLNQSIPVITSDGAGGIIAAFVDDRMGASFNIFAQHMFMGGWLGIESMTDPTEISIYPNPTSNWFTLINKTNSIDNYKINLINSLGVIVYSTTTNSNQTNFDLTNHPAGIYFVEIKSSSVNEIQKIVKQ
jgi:hypothetical protein